jgi:hypothetical protein
MCSHFFEFEFLPQDYLQYVLHRTGVGGIFEFQDNNRSPGSYIHFLFSRARTTIF